MTKSFLYGRCVGRNDNAGPRRPYVSAELHLLPDEELIEPEVVQALASLLDNVCRRERLSRRETPNWMLDQYYRFLGTVFDGNGYEFNIEAIDVDEAFNDDGSFRWLSDFLKYKDERPRQRMQRRVALRLQLILLALLIDGVDRADAGDRFPPEVTH